MSTAALKTSRSAGGNALGAVVRHLDFVALALALPVFVAAGWSLSGYAVAAAVWITQGFVQARLQKKVDTSDDPRTVVGLVAGGSLARAWFAAIAVLVAGLIDERTGLAAVVLILVLFTVYFFTKVVGHYYEQAGAALERAELGK
ncbi:MAG: hypothetical protein WAO61_01425 [Solirubrobacterales bacterium]